MRCPVFLPEELRECVEIADEESLYTHVTEDPARGLLFLITACKDQTWTQEHLSWVQQMFQWATQAFYRRELSQHSLQPLIEAVQEHRVLLAPLLMSREGDPPTGVVCYYTGGEGMISSLLVGAQSARWFDRMMRECWQTRTFAISVPEIDDSLFFLFQEYWISGANAALWKQEMDTLVRYMERAREWGMEELVKQIAETMRRYLDKSRVGDMLLEAHRKRLHAWKEICYDFISTHFSGVVCPHRASDQLTLRFEFFSEEALDLFHALQKEWTVLGFAGNLIEHPLFGQILRECPRLYGLDLSGTEGGNPPLLEIPSAIREIDLSGCSWADDQRLSVLVKRIPGIESLLLENNLFLSHIFWGELTHAKQLYSLSLRGCTQIGEEEALLILCSIPRIRKLSFHGCGQVGDRSMAEIPRHCPKMEELDLTACLGITDRTLSECAYSSLPLRKMILSRCPQITIRGVHALLRGMKDLELLNLERCQLDEKRVEELRRDYPHVQIIYV